MASRSTLAVRIAFVDMLVSGFSIRVTDLVGGQSHGKCIAEQGNSDKQCAI